MNAYLDTNSIIRISCGNCDFKDKMHLEDITLGDFWGAKEEYDDDKGTSVILVNSQMGKRFVDMLIDCERMNMFPCEKTDVVRGNPMFVRSVDRADDSEHFIKLLESNNFSKAYQIYQEKTGKKR
jgi:hypothetical protein